jgi:hypothetical protein
VSRIVKHIRTNIYIEAVFRFGLYRGHPRGVSVPVDVTLWIDPQLTAPAIAALIVDDADRTALKWYGRGFVSYSSLVVGPIELEQAEPFLAIRAALNVD